jgi:hypothetical protein
VPPWSHRLCLRPLPPLARILALALPFASACGSPHEAAPRGAVAGLEGGTDGGPVAPYHPAASCLVTIDAPPLQDPLHVAIGTDIQYDSNPPSSGSHYPIWAAFQMYDTPVPRGYYVHDLEHEGVVLLYNCPDAGCAPDLVAQLQSVIDAIPDDPLCAGTGVRVRGLITPDPLIAGPIAAAAWGWTYNADCLDLPSLLDFALAHYGQNREPTCAVGTTEF